jgi:hypothetical protein
MTDRQTAIVFLNTVIEPAIQAISLWSPAAGQLLLGTALQESKLYQRRQIGGGPALGLFQMEPITHDDIWESYLRYRPVLAGRVLVVAQRTEPPDAEWLVTHDRYAAAMARIKYLRSPEVLPAGDDVVAMAAYWGKFYNSRNESDKIQQFIDTWRQVMGE